MFQALKWAYNRGREYERMRLKKLTAEMFQKVEFQRQRQPFIASRDDPDGGKQHQFDLAVNEKVVQTLDHMILPQTSDSYTQEVTSPLIDNEK